ncbi:MAG: MBL fold metallo-hydrolase [Mycobacterium sp.]
MQITHLGHACVLIEIGGTRLLIDPGTLSRSADATGDIDAILFTHSHVDHLDIDAVHKLVESNTAVALVADADSARVLAEAGITDVRTLDSPDGVQLDVAGIGVEATTVPHATIHCDLPDMANNTYVIADSILHPGDAFWSPPHPVDVLLLPIGGPWMKLSESIDYLRSVAPRVAVPIHQGGLAAAHRGLHCDLLRKLAPAGTEITTLTGGQSAEL